MLADPGQTAADVTSKVASGRDVTRAGDHVHRRRDLDVLPGDDVVHRIRRLARFTADPAVDSGL